MNLPRSTYYYQSKSKAVNDSELIALIEAMIEEFPGYGYRRVTRELHRQDMPVNHRKILRIMRQRRLTRKTKRRWIKTTDSRYHLYCHPERICLFGGHSGFVCPKSHGLRYFTQHRYRPVSGRSYNGHQ